MPQSPSGSVRPAAGRSGDGGGNPDCQRRSSFEAVSDHQTLVEAPTAEVLGVPCVAAIQLKLLVLKTRQVDKLRAFYHILGVEFAAKRHGDGPLHYAGRVGETVLEIYPLAGRLAPDAAIRLGFAVADLDAVVQAVRGSGSAGRPSAARLGLGSPCRGTRSRRSCRRVVPIGKALTARDGIRFRHINRICSPPFPHRSFAFAEQ